MLLHAGASGAAGCLRRSQQQQPAPKAVAGTISSLRVRPFTPATPAGSSSSSRSGVRARSAEPDLLAGPTEAEEAFSFSFSDAKKANEYSVSDVEAALAYYEGEGEAPGEANSEFVENMYGIEDATFFDDIDNSEAYGDEFVVAGIPEAAPKEQRKGGGRPGEGGPEGEEESDEFSAAKRQAQLKSIEEQMVLDAELEDTGMERTDRDLETKAVGPSVWDWMGDVAQEQEDDEEVSTLAAGSNRQIAAAVVAALPSDEQIFADLRTANLQDIDTDTKETIEFLLDDFDIDNELKAIPDNAADAFEAPEAVGLAADSATVARIDALLAEDLSLPELDMSGLSSFPQIVDDGLSMSDEAVEKYLASIKGVEAASMTEAEVTAMFGDDEPGSVVLVTDDEPAITMDDVDLTDIVVSALPESELAMPAIEDNYEAEVDEVDDFRAELVSLQRVPDAFFEAPTDEEVEVLDQYLNASEQFIAEEEDRRMKLAQQVAAGQLSSDVLLEESGEIVDVEGELLLPDDMEDETFGEEEGAGEEEENWQERIIELTRVTKVVKGGKLMGFRCTAVVGNGKGLVGVGCQAGREVATAVKRALVDAKKNVVMVPLVGAATVPHRVEAKFNAARCVVVPAADGTGVLAGSSIRSVLELAGVQNVLAKRIGCRSLLNNARCTVAALSQLQTLQEASKSRGVPIERLLLPRK